MRGLKSTVERLLGPAARGILRSGLAGSRSLILAYHNVIPDRVPPVGDVSLHLPVASFARQLDLLLEYCDILPLEQLIDSERTDRLAVAITFDDAYRGALTLGAAELSRRDLPATMFVPPGLLNDRTFWWDDLAAGRTGLSPEFRQRALIELRGEDMAIRASLKAAGEGSGPAYMRSGTEAELASFAETSRFGVGAHSWSHPNLATLRGAELERELAPPLTWLRERFPTSVVPWLAYPYGLSSPIVEAAAQGAGYRGALLVEGGRFRQGTQAPFAIPRVNVPSGLSLDGFVLRVAGLRS